VATVLGNNTSKALDMTIVGGKTTHMSPSTSKAILDVSIALLLSDIRWSTSLLSLEGNVKENAVAEGGVVETHVSRWVESISGVALGGN
jgi:hypothetical protein